MPLRKRFLLPSRPTTHPSTLNCKAPSSKCCARVCVYRCASHPRLFSVRVLLVKGKRAPTAVRGYAQPKRRVLSWGSGWGPWAASAVLSVRAGRRHTYHSRFLHLQQVQRRWPHQPHAFLGKPRPRWCWFGSCCWSRCVLAVPFAA